MRTLQRWCVGGVLVLPAGMMGCRSHLLTQPPSAPATVPAPLVPTTPTPQKRFENSADGIAFMYPGNWQPLTGGNSELQISSGSSKFTLDVPKLPFHIPGLIPIDQVRSGYVDDVKKRMPDLAQANLPDPTLPDAKQRWVKLTGHINGKSSIDEAVLIVHNDKVYILIIDSDDAGYPAAKAALDDAVKSLQWIK